MLQCEDLNPANGECSAVSSVRERIRGNIREARNKHRHDKIDSLRIAPNELESLSIELTTFNKDDILAMARTIKKNRHITPVELQKLGHAFLQDADNIECFLSINGALNVMVKEFIGNFHIYCCFRFKFSIFWMKFLLKKTFFFVIHKQDKTQKSKFLPLNVFAIYRSALNYHVK